MDLGKEIENKKVVGTVEEMVFGGPSRAIGIVEGDTVYETVIGGPRRIVGYVKDGVAYEPVMGGPPIVIGKVRYNQKE